MHNTNILLCGVGGQGTVLSSKILARCAIARGENAHTAETIGMAQRGGCVTSHVRLGACDSPLIPKGTADAIIAFEPAEAVRSLDYLKKGGVIVVNTAAVKPVTDTLSDSRYTARTMLDYLRKLPLRVLFVDAEAIARRCGSPKVANIALLGAAAASGCVGTAPEEIENVIGDLSPRFREANLKALRLGTEAVKQGGTAMSEAMEWRKNRHLLLVKKHQQLNQYAQKGQIVFAGSSLMEDFPIGELAQNLPGRPVVYNRGIGGDTLEGFAARLDSAVLDLAPRLLFINIGTNDISAPDYRRETMLAKYRALLESIRAALPETRIVVMSYYPVNRTNRFETGWFGARTNEEIDAVNLCLQKLATDLGLEYVDVTSCLRDENGNLEEILSIDGMHMLPDGYARVLKILSPLIR